MKAKINLILINILSIYCLNPNERGICPTDRIDVITKQLDNRLNPTLITIKEKYVWTQINGRTEQIEYIEEKWPQLPQYFHNNISALVFDEEEGVSLIFKGQYFSIIKESELMSYKELGTYFPKMSKVDAALLISDQREQCWQHFRCKTLHLFEGHFLWSFNWFHFWHINSRTEYNAINLKSINVNFPDNLDAVFAQNNYIFLIKDNYFFRIPINKFPLQISNQDLNRESLFDQIIRCEFNTHLNRRQMIEEPMAAHSSNQETISKESNQTIDSSSNDKIENISAMNQNKKDIEINSTLELSTISQSLSKKSIENQMTIGLTVKSVNNEQNLTKSLDSNHSEDNNTSLETTSSEQNIENQTLIYSEDNDTSSETTLSNQTTFQNDGKQTLIDSVKESADFEQNVPGYSKPNESSLNVRTKAFDSQTTVANITESIIDIEMNTSIDSTFTTSQSLSQTTIESKITTFSSTVQFMDDKQNLTPEETTFAEQNIENQTSIYSEDNTSSETILSTQTSTENNGKQTTDSLNEWPESQENTSLEKTFSDQNIGNQMIGSMKQNKKDFETNGSQNLNGKGLQNNSHNNRAKGKPLLMSITTVWITIIVLIFGTIIMGLFLWKKMTNRRGYYSLQNE